MSAPKRPRLLLDTHVWIWLSFGAVGHLKPALRARLAAANQDEPLHVSIISVWEIAMLAAKGRLNLFTPVEAWIERALAHPGIRLLGLEHPAVAVDSCNLPGEFHADPADRFLVATARVGHYTLVTHDQKIIDYGKAGHVRVLAA